MGNHYEENTYEAPAAAPTPAPAITPEQIVAEATNDPRMTDLKFTFGGREFPVISLSYRQYLGFTARLKPIIDLIAGRIKASVIESQGKAETLSVQGIVVQTLGSLDPNYLFNFCADDLPAMVEIVCNMGAIKEERLADLVSVKWVEDNATSPFELVNIVLMQVQKNNMIVEFASFFAQVLPLFLGRKTAS